MKKSIKCCLAVSIALLMAFILWTIAVCFVDVKAVGPENSSVGFAALNQYVHNLTGVNFNLYDATDLFSIVPLAICACFGLIGLIQWFKRKSLAKVDYNIFVLGGFYVVVIATFLLFEKLAINYRPVLIEGRLEASYPSSTTLLVMCVMPTALMQLNNYIKNKLLKNIVSVLIIAFTAFMVIGRIISGVHWITDIIGGALFSAALVMMFYCICNLKSK